MSMSTGFYNQQWRPVSEMRGQSMQSLPRNDQLFLALYSVCENQVKHLIIYRYAKWVKYA